MQLCHSVLSLGVRFVPMCTVTVILNPSGKILNEPLYGRLLTLCALWSLNWRENAVPCLQPIRSKDPEHWPIRGQGLLAAGKCQDNLLIFSKA